ncbi:MAG: ROK family protein [Chloroflexi bacterium]|nr:ROK family protein [Chloroflexota bacterium]
MSNLYGGIEAGGTKFVCAIGTGPDDLRETRFPTTTPGETINRAIAFFREQQQSLAAIGIGSFGPIDIHADSPTYGFITTTPKPGWANVDLVGEITRAFNVPVGFDTDVNGAALGEHRWGAAQRLDTFIYLTIGTGIGGGGLASGKLLHGLIHPEMAHGYLPHDRARDPFDGVCPFHGDCFEGLASGPAMEKRWQQRAENLPIDHPAWALEAHYIALALMNYICILSPQRIILGGGVMEQAELFPMIRREVQQLLNGYIHSPEILERIDNYIVPPGLGKRAGVLGAIALAQAIV